MNFITKIRRPFKYTFCNATFIIIGLNIACFILTAVWPALKFYFSLNVVSVIKSHYFWQFFTYMFTHADFSHLFLNMLGLLFFGLPVERSLGSKEFVLLYTVSGVLCGLFSFAFYFVSRYYNVLLLGASGAVYAILLAFSVIFPRSRIYIMGLIPVPAPLMIATYAIIALGSQLFGMNGSVAHMTHLAGFVVAWFYFLIRIGMNPWKVWRDAFRG